MEQKVEPVIALWKEFFASPRHQIIKFEKAALVKNKIHLNFVHSANFGKNINFFFSFIFENL